MKLSDIRGRKALNVMADAMELAEMLAEDDRLKGLREDLKAASDGGNKMKLMSRFVPIVRDSRYQDRLLSILAAASDTPLEEYEENGSVLADLVELLLSDSEMLGFLTGSAIAAGQPGES